MSYTPTTWHGGDVLSAEAMNKIENGIAASEALEVQINSDGSLDKTWQEIYDAFPKVYCVDQDEGKCNIFSVYVQDDSYIVETNSVLSTDSPDGYPTISSLPSDGGGGDVTIK